MLAEYLAIQTGAHVINVGDVMEQAILDVGAASVPWRSAIGPLFLERYPPSRVAELLLAAIPRDGPSVVLDSVRLELTCNQIRRWPYPAVIWNVAVPEGIRLERLTRRLTDAGFNGGELESALRDYGLFDSEDDLIRSSCDVTIANGASVDEFVAKGLTAYRDWMEAAQ